MHHQPRTNNCTEPPSLVARTIVLSCLTLLALAASGVGISGTAGLERGLALVFGLIVLAIVGIDRGRQSLIGGGALLALAVIAATFRPGYEGSAGFAAALIAALHLVAGRRAMIPARVVGALVAMLALHAASRGIDWLWIAQQNQARMASAGAEFLTGLPVRWNASVAGINLALVGVLLAITGAASRSLRATSMALVAALLVPLAVTTAGALSFADIIVGNGSLGSTLPFLIQWLFVPALALVDVLCDPKVHDAEATERKPGRWSVQRVAVAGLAVALVAVLPASTPAPSTNATTGHRILIIDENLMPGAYEPPSWERLTFTATGIFSEYAALLERLGHPVERSGRPLDLAQLDETDILVFTNPARAFSDAEDKAIAGFVERGGGLLVMADHTDLMGLMNPTNQLIARYGMRLRFDTAMETHRALVGDLIVRDLGVLPAGTDAIRAQIMHGASLDVAAPGRPLVIGRTMYSDFGDRENGGMGAFLGDYKLLPASEPLGDLVLAASAEAGQGRVIVFGDTSSFQSVALGRSAAFIADTFAWLGGREDSTPAFPWAAFLAGGLALGLGFVRPRHAGAPALASIVLVVAGLVAGESRSDRDNARLTADLAPRSAVILHDDGLAFGDRDQFQPHSTEGLFLCAARYGLTGLLADLHHVDDLDRARSIVIAAPARALNKDLQQRLRTWIKDGGHLVIAVGYEESAPIRDFLFELGFSVGAQPLGAAPVLPPYEQRDWKGPRFLEAWPVVSNPSIAADSEVLFGQDGLAIVTRRMIGAGSVTVIGDSWFFNDKNFEGESTVNTANVNLWRRIAAGN